MSDSVENKTEQVEKAVPVKKVAAKATKKVTSTPVPEVAPEVVPTPVPAPEVVEHETIDSGVAVSWKERVLVEREAVFANIKKLTAYIESDEANALEAEDREDLVSQLDAMQLYRRALDTRIHKF